MGYEPEEPEKPAEPKIPIEPNGHDLTRLRGQIADTKEKMTKTANEIIKLLQDEQKRQQKYRDS